MGNGGRYGLEVLTLLLHYSPYTFGCTYRTYSLHVHVGRSTDQLALSTLLVAYPHHTYCIHTHVFLVSVEVPVTDHSVHSCCPCIAYSCLLPACFLGDAEVCTCVRGCERASWGYREGLGHVELVGGQGASPAVCSNRSSHHVQPCPREQHPSPQKPPGRPSASSPARRPRRKSLTRPPHPSRKGMTHNISLAQPRPRGRVR